MREFVHADLSDAECAQLNAEKESIYRELYTPHLKTVVGFNALIASAKKNGLALAVATSAPPENIVFTLDGLNIRHHFNAIVGAADVKRGKPEPDVFLTAARRCGVPPERCIVFEDAPLGVEAARRAGMRAVVLTTTMPAEEFSAFDNLLAIAADFSSVAINALSANGKAA